MFLQVYKDNQILFRFDLTLHIQKKDQNIQSDIQEKQHPQYDTVMFMKNIHFFSKLCSHSKHCCYQEFFLFLGFYQFSDFIIIQIFVVFFGCIYTEE